MNPYRKNQIPKPSPEEPPERGDELILLVGWFFLGCLLVASDMSQAEPWGVAFSLGMLILIVATVALWRHLMIRRHWLWKWIVRIVRGRPEV